MPEPRTAIIGAGLSGLATSYFLAQLGIRSVLIEKSSRLGGLIRTDLVEGCTLEAGADSYLAAKPAVTELARELSLDSEIIGSNDAARRAFVVRESRLVPLPRGMVMMVPGDWAAALRSPLFSPRTKLRFLTETRSRPRIREKDVSVSDFVADHFGSELAAYVAEPLLAGVYGGDSGSLSAASVLPRFLDYERAYGSLIRAVRRERRQAGSGPLFRSFRDGMQTLTDALSPHAAVTHADAQRIERSNGRWRIRHGQGSLEADDLVLACPTHAAALLLDDLSPALAAELAAIPYSSAMLVTLVYERSKLAHPLDGFGFLVPQPERRTISAATWVNTKFPTRIPNHLAAVRAFIVADEAVKLAGASMPELMGLVRSDLARFMGIEIGPRFSAVHKWPHSMPQYVVGHQERIGKIRAALTDLPGLYLTGNAYEGVGLPDCVRLAKETAKRVFASRAS